MPLMNITSTMTANGTATPLNGQQYEFLQAPAYCEFAVLADTGATVLGTVYSGSDLLMESSQLQILAVASPIIKPDHYTLNDWVNKGERLKVNLVEAAGGTPKVRTSVIVTFV